MKFKLLIFLSISVLLLVAGCKKGNNNSSAKIYLLSQITDVSGTVTSTLSFKYDDQNHIIEYTNNANNVDCKITYDSNDRVVVKDQYSGTPTTDVRTSFDYSTPNAVMATTTGSPSIPVGSTPAVYTLNDKSQPIKLLLGNGNGAYSLYTYDDTGNLLTEITYLNVATTTSPSTSVSYTYDQNKSYLANVKGNLFFILGSSFVNNCLNQTAKDLARVNGVTNFSNSTFEYNADGYPVKETRILSSSATPTLTTHTYLYTYITK